MRSAPAAVLYRRFVASEMAARDQGEQPPSFADLVSRHPEHAQQLRVLRSYDRVIVEPGQGDLEDRFPPGHDVGPYRIVRRIGSGGMGRVYAARDRTTGAEVALKTLRDDAGEDVLARFRREVRIAMRLRHPAIVTCLGVECSGSQPFLVMEFVSGGDLEAALRERRAGDARLLAIVTRVAEAVDHAHRAGVCHRDLKPQNILLDRDQQPKVADFGLAAFVDATSLTLPGHVPGTVSYMAPELFGEDADASDPRGDVYSLGAILYRGLLDRRPYGDLTAGAVVAAKAAGVAPVPPRRVRPDLARDLEDVIVTAMATQPERRYASAAELARDLIRFQKTGRTHAGARRRARRARRLLSAALALALVVLAVSVLVPPTRLASARDRLWEIHDLGERWRRGLDVGAAREWIDRLGDLDRKHTEVVSAALLKGERHFDAATRAHVADRALSILRRQDRWDHDRSAAALMLLDRFDPERAPAAIEICLAMAEVDPLSIRGCLMRGYSPSAGRTPAFIEALRDLASSEGDPVAAAHAIATLVYHGQGVPPASFGALCAAWSSHEDKTRVTATTAVGVLALASPRLDLPEDWSTNLAEAARDADRPALAWEATLALARWGDDWACGKLGEVCDVPAGGSPLDWRPRLAAARGRALEDEPAGRELFEHSCGAFPREDPLVDVDPVLWEWCRDSEPAGASFTLDQESSEDDTQGRVFVSFARSPPSMVLDPTVFSGFALTGERCLREFASTPNLVLPAGASIELRVGARRAGKAHLEVAHLAGANLGVPGGARAEVRVILNEQAENLEVTRPDQEIWSREFRLRKGVRDNVIRLEVTRGPSHYRVLWLRISGP